LAIRLEKEDREEEARKIQPEERIKKTKRIERMKEKERKMNRSSRNSNQQAEGRHMSPARIFLRISDPKLHLSVVPRILCSSCFFFWQPSE